MSSNLGDIYGFEFFAALAVTVIIDSSSIML